MKIIKKFIIRGIIFFFICSSPLLAVDRNRNSLNYKIFIGYGYFDYQAINNQLNKYHQIDGIQILPNIGLEIEYCHPYFILANQISSSFENYQNKEFFKRQHFNFWGIQNQIKLGYFLINRKNYKFLPFVGLLLEYLSINTDFNYGIKSIDCFFQYQHKYRNFNSGILYGISYEQGFSNQHDIINNIKLGFNLGGIISVSGEKWWVDKQAIPRKRVPIGNFRYFANLKLLYQF